MIHIMKICTTKRSHYQRLISITKRAIYKIATMIEIRLSSSMANDIISCPGHLDFGKSE